MSKKLKHYQPSRLFKKHLKKHGLAAYAVAPVAANESAERVLPRSAKSRLPLYTTLLVLLLSGLSSGSVAAEMMTIGSGDGSSIVVNQFFDWMIAGVALLMSSFPSVISRYHSLIQAHQDCDRKKLFFNNLYNNVHQSNETSLHIKAGGTSSQGQVRHENQDAFAVQQIDPHTALIVVCDGVGGHPGGAEAAQTATQYLATYLSTQFRHGGDHVDLLKMSLLDLQDAFAMVQQRGMTTVIVALWTHSTLYYATLGDGELMVFFPDQMTQKLLTPHHALDAPSNIITAYLSSTDIFVPRLGMVVLPANALVLAMSDGISDIFPQHSIQQHLVTWRKFAHDHGMNSFCEHTLGAIEFSRDDTGAWLHSDNLTLAAMIGEENEDDH